MVLNVRTALDFSMLFTVFLAATWHTGDQVELDLNTMSQILALMLAWAISTVLTRKFNQTYHATRFGDRVAPFVKGGMLLALMVWVVQSALGWDNGLLATACIFAVVEIAVVSVLVLLNVAPDIFSKTTDRRRESAKSEQTDLVIDGGNCAQPVDVVALFKNAEIAQRDHLADLIAGTVEPTGRGSGKAAFAAEVVGRRESEPVSLLVSLKRLNDIRRLNKYLLACYEAILPGGWLVVKYTAMENVRTGFPFFHFLFHRVFPRLPRVNRVYFSMTKGRNRVLSKAEVWGRLHYCGFEVLDEKNLDGESVVVVRKTRTPSRDANPSYYPVIKLDRVGKDGKIVQIYKIRTMHPYSEYIQKKVFEQNQLSETGKFGEDFRRTGWGKFLRQYWLDEIPQIFDWLRGDLKLVGICAMSEHYFSLYTRKYQELFKKVKPGLVPPLLEENLHDFKQIIEFEQAYLESYLAHPVKTDLRYLGKAFHQIIFKGRRSG